MGASTLEMENTQYSGDTSLVLYYITLQRPMDKTVTINGKTYSTYEAIQKDYGHYYELGIQTHPGDGEIVLGIVVLIPILTVLFTAFCEKLIRDGNERK